MSSNSIFSSVQSETRWVLAMEKNFPRDHIVNIDFDTPCVFRVPITLTEENPEAYTPHHLGLGPYHHLRPDLYIMHNHKLAAVRKFLSPEKLQNFQRLVDRLVQSETIIRACYDHYLDLDIQTLAWILAIDAIYLLQFLKNYPQMENLAGDILMLENQVPFILLDKIRQILELAPDDADDMEMLVFLNDHSPLELNEFGIAESLPGNITHAHLLHCMYRMIVTKRSPIFTTYRLQLSDVVQGVQFLAEQGLPGAGTAGQVLSFVSKIPWDKISGLCKKGWDDEQTPLAEEINIPSASQMCETAGIKFIATDGGIRDIRFEDSEDGRKFCLPIIRVTATSEVVLRNLVAYEEASVEEGSLLVLAEYVDLMCGIIDSAKDVGILKNEKIMESELSDREIAHIFNKISKSRKKKDAKSNVEEAIGDVNTRYNNLTSVRVKRFLAEYGCALFKFTSVVITIVVVVLLILQAFCSVFGCARWFSKSTMQSLSLWYSYQ